MCVGCVCGVCVSERERGGGYSASNISGRFTRFIIEYFRRSSCQFSRSVIAMNHLSTTNGIL